MVPDANKVSLLYRGSRDGWTHSDFHTYCDSKGRTLSLFLSSKGYLAAGYTSVPWSRGGDLEREDKEAFLI